MTGTDVLAMNSTTRVQRYVVDDDGESVLLIDSGVVSHRYCLYQDWNAAGGDCEARAGGDVEGCKQQADCREEPHWARVAREGLDGRLTSNWGPGLEISEVVSVEIFVDQPDDMASVAQELIQLASMWFGSDSDCPTRAELLVCLSDAALEARTERLDTLLLALDSWKQNSHCSVTVRANPAWFLTHGGRFADIAPLSRLEVAVGCLSQDRQELERSCQVIDQISEMGVVVRAYASTCLDSSEVGKLEMLCRVNRSDGVTLAVDPNCRALGGTREWGDVGEHSINEAVSVFLRLSQVLSGFIERCEPWRSIVASALESHARSGLLRSSPTSFRWRACEGWSKLSYSAVGTTWQSVARSTMASVNAGRANDWCCESPAVVEFRGAACSDCAIASLCGGMRSYDLSTHLFLQHHVDASPSLELYCSLRVAVLEMLFDEYRAIASAEGVVRGPHPLP